MKKIFKDKINIILVVVLVLLMLISFSLKIKKVYTPSRNVAIAYLNSIYKGDFRKARKYTDYVESNEGFPRGLADGWKTVESYDYANKVKGSKLLISEKNFDDKSTISYKYVNYKGEEVYSDSINLYKYEGKWRVESDE